MARCPCMGTTLDKLIQPTILAILAHDKLHGYRIAARVAELTITDGSPPDLTGVYRTLRAMQRRGLIAATKDPSDMGPVRKSYALTAAGRDCLNQWITTLARYHHAIESLLCTVRKASCKCGCGKRGRR